MPRFSILVPSFNYGRFIGSSIRSILGQSVSDFEILIQDSASTDETSAVIDSHSDARIRFTSVRDAGQSNALNLAFQGASGDYVSWLNADEFLLPGCLDAVARTFESNPNAGLVFGDCVLVDAGGRVIRLLPSHDHSDFVLRHYGCYLSSCAVFVRRDVLPAAPWDETLRRAMDWDLWLRLSTMTDFVHCQRALAAFRVHPAQVTAVPERIDSAEFQNIRHKHGIQSAIHLSVAGRLGHIALKARGGHYVRQFEARRRYRGEQADWLVRDDSVASALTAL